MAYIKKLGDNKYSVRISKGTGANRQQYYKTIRGTKTDAEKWARKNETKLDLDEPIKTDSLTFKQFYEKWKKQIAHKFTPKTCHTYAWLIDNFFLSSLGKLRLDRIKRSHVQDCIDKMRDSKKYRQATITKAAVALSSMFTSAVKQERILVNPCRLLEFPRADKKEIIVLDEFEVPLFISACQDHEKGLCFELALETGMRPSEWLALQWQDIDFQNNIIRVRRSVHYSEKKFYFKEPKVLASVRNIEVSEALINRLKAHPQTDSKFNLVFPKKNGIPYHFEWLRNPLKQVLSNAGIDKNLTLYGLRHTCATLLLLEGENPQAVAARLGDKSVVTILDNYAHFLPTMQKRASEKLNAILRG